MRLFGWKKRYLALIKNRSVYVLVMRRGALSEREKINLEQSFPDKILIYRHCAPENGKRWLDLCKKAGSTEQVLVFLPAEKPLSTAAMNAGYIHVASMPDGKLLRLKEVKTEFEPF